MNLLNTLLNSTGNGAVQSAAKQFGLDRAGAESLLSSLMPALAGGIRRNASRAGGLEALTKALSSGNHQRYLDNPEALREQSAVNDGNAILGHLFGSKDVSREVAANAAQSTGINESIIKKFLPLAAAAAMGAMSKETSNGAGLAQQGTGLLGKLLDTDGDGSVVDNLLSIGKRFL
jgi:hypothetical protein